MGTPLSRRGLFRAAGAASSLAIVGRSLFDTTPAVAATPPLVRRDVGGMSAADPVILSYRNAVRAMKALPTSDPRNWTYQAAIHGTLLSPAQTAWSTCEHHTYFFWSWHRMYLYWFERIVRKLSGDPCWALPYWNWTSQRQLPPTFRDTNSELYVPNRSVPMNDGTGSLSLSLVDYSAAFSLINFGTASGSLESQNHDGIHVAVGGLNGWMSSIRTAAQDPIFYLHHANVDRLWSLWLEQAGGRSDPLSDSTWKTRQFTFFDENSTPVQMTGCEVLRTAEQLGYVYEGEPAPVTESCLRIIRVPPWERALIFRLPIPPFELGGDPVSVDFDLKPLRERLAALVESRTETPLLELDGVEAEKQPGVVWEVSLGARADALKDGAQSPGFLGNVALFSTGIRSESHHGKFEPATFAFPARRALQAALKRGSDRVEITFVPGGVLTDGKPSRPEVASKVRIGAIRLSVERQRAE